MHGKYYFLIVKCTFCTVHVSLAHVSGHIRSSKQELIVIATFVLNETRLEVQTFSVTEAGMHGRTNVFIIMGGGILVELSYNHLHTHHTLEV